MIRASAKIRIRKEKALIGKYILILLKKGGFFLSTKFCFSPKPCINLFKNNS